MATLSPEHHKFPRSRSELVKKLEVWTVDSEGIYREYERLQEFTKETVSGSTEVAEEHRKDNRYKDILPYNWRSVKIPREDPKPGEDHNKYINASWILFKNYKQKFIASQAPLEDTIPDFWHCVVHHSVTMVVMLTDLVEGTKVKCAQYWPSSGNALYSDTEYASEASGLAIAQSDQLAVKRDGSSNFSQNALWPSLMTYIKPNCCQLSPVHPPLAKLCHRSLLFARGFGHSLRLATRRQAPATSDTCAANLGSCRQ